MFKLIILLTKKQAMSDDEFARYLLEVHAPLAKNMPGIIKYVVNIVQRPPNREPDYHAAAELWFDGREAMRKAFSSPQGEVTQKDTERFTSKILTLFVNEHEIS
jgi:uncharacterized protein (TIGR02118 family)